MYVGGNSLYTINPATGATTYVATPSVEIRGMAFRSDGTLFVSTGDQTLGTLNTSTGAFSLIGTITGPYSDGVQGLGFNSSDTLYGVTPAFGVTPGLYTISTATGAATFVGDPGIDVYQSLVFTPSGRLFAIGNYGYMSEINPSNAATIGGAVDVSAYDFRGLEFVAAAASPEATLSSATYSVGEGDGTVTVTVNLDVTPASSCSVNYASSNGTATAGSDYTTASGSPLVINNPNTSGTFNVSITDDSTFDEGSETFGVSITANSGCTVGSPSTATVTITENDISGSLSTVYVDFDKADTPPQDGESAGTAYGTFGRGLAAVQTGGVIKINGTASDTESEWTGTISTAMTIQADPAGTIRIGVPGTGSATAPLRDDDAGTLADDAEAFLRALQLALANAAAAAARDADAEDGALGADGAVHEPVVPFTLVADAVRAAQANSVLAIRLRSEAGIDPDSIWGPAPDGAASVEWLPVEEGDLRDVWVLFKPQETGFVDDVVSLSAGARTREGESIESETYQFQVESEQEYQERLAESEQGIWQPDVGEDFDTALVAPADDVASQSLAEGVDEPFTIGPERVYDEPQRVWLPIPAGGDAANVQVYYYHATGEDQGWYPAENVEGWLVPDSYLCVEAEGATYLGFLVRHAGIVQLGIPLENE